MTLVYFWMSTLSIYGLLMQMYLLLEMLAWKIFHSLSKKTYIIGNFQSEIKWWLWINNRHFPFQARNKPADGSVINAQKLQSGQRTPTHGAKNAGPKTPCKPGQKPVAAQKGQPIKQAPAKVAAAAAAAVPRTTKKTKKGKHHQHDLIVTINLVSVLLSSFLLDLHQK